MGRRTSALAALFIGTLASGGASADPPPPAERGQIVSRYEQETIDIVLKSLAATRDLSPEGKTIEHVEIVPLEVLEPRDPAPRFLNVFHATTRKSVIRDELLLREGARYQQVFIDDTIRNLRRLPELSLVLVVATRGSAPDRVGLVVITKDVWSLRLGWGVVGTAGGLEELNLEPTETNILGTQQTVLGEYIYQPSTHTLGGGYTIHRLPHSRIALVASADAVVNKQTGKLEGSYGNLTMGEPLYSGLTPWAWDAQVAWLDYIYRRYQNAQPGLYFDKTTGLTVPYQFHEHQYGVAYELVRSFGWALKHDFTLSAAVSHDVYRTQLTGYNPTAVADFAAHVLPVSDTRVGPALAYHVYERRYLRVVDFETLALQEDFSLGFDGMAKVFPSFRALGGSRDVVDVQASLQYGAAFRDGMARVFLITEEQEEPHRLADALLNAGAYVSTPTIAGVGRLVANGAFVSRYRNYLNTVEYQGGNEQLRGFPTNFFVGKDVVDYSLEFRTRPIEVLACEIGAVAFYDAADAFNGFANLRPYQSVGLGVRGLFPQLDRVVLRADIGFPLERPVDPTTNGPIPRYGLIVTFGQAFPVPTIEPQPVLPTGASEFENTSAQSGP